MSGETYVYWEIERQFDHNHWYAWSEKLHETSAREGYTFCKESFPDYQWRLVKIEKTVIENE